MPSEKEKWLKFHEKQYQFKVPLLLYADSESMIKPVDEQYIEKMIKMKAGRKGNKRKGKHPCTIRLVCT